MRKTKRPTKAEREQAARETEAKNDEIRAQHDEAERQVKAREEEERRKAADAAQKTRDEEYVAAEKKRTELGEKIRGMDVELVALKKALRETEHLDRIALLDLIRFPDEEHHAKACDLADKLFTLANVYDVRHAERELLVAQRDRASSTWSSLLPFAMGGMAYFISSMFRTTATRDAPKSP